MNLAKHCLRSPFLFVRFECVKSSIRLEEESKKAFGTT